MREMPLSLYEKSREGEERARTVISELHLPILLGLWQN